jgi:hypothetical protein
MWGQQSRGLAATTIALSCVFVCAMILVQMTPSIAQDAGGEQQRLYQQMVRQPTNYAVTSAFVRVATANGDYEAAIGALERLLYYNPNLAHVKYELGMLYYRLGAYEMARRYFREAQASPALDDATKESITAYLTNADRQTQQSRFSGFAQTGLRYQSNANFGPSSGIARFSGVDQSLSSTAKRAPDWNWFSVVGLSNDYDVENQRGDILETRFIGYDSQQFKFHDLDVGLIDLSIGPRMILAPELLAGATIKPYLVGGNTWVGSARYLTSGGAGLQVKLPFGNNLTVTPEFEWRNVNYNSTDPTPTATFATGNMFTGGISSTLTISEQTKLDARGYFRRGLASFSFQTYDQWVGESALTIQFAPPIRTIPSSWSVAPFARYIRTNFDAANPYIDPLTVRTDDEWIAGVTFNAPFSNKFGISATVQYDRTNSTLPNYSENNVSVMAGPTARF